MRLRLWGAFVAGLMLLAACGDDGAGAATSEASTTVAATITTVAATITTVAEASTTVAATTTVAELSAAQAVYCEDLTSVITVDAPGDRWELRPESVAFMEIAYRLGYLLFPYKSWGNMTAMNPEDFLNYSFMFSESFVEATPSGLRFGHDVGNALRNHWRDNLGDADLFDQAFRETCLQAWELR